MTQSEIVNNLAEKTGLKKQQVKDFFNTLSTMATSEVKKNGEFTLPGFGKFVKSKRKAREGRNPATGEALKIPAKNTVKFRASKTLKDAVGSGK
jgi:DNA-binding protein HU-beta